MEGLTVGRMVHYVAYGTPGGEYQAGAHRAAIVAQVNDATQEQMELGECVLMVVNPTGIHFNTARFDPHTKRPGTWHWIEKA